MRENINTYTPDNTSNGYSGNSINKNIKYYSKSNTTNNYNNDFKNLLEPNKLDNINNNANNINIDDTDDGFLQPTNITVGFKKKGKIIKDF